MEVLIMIICMEIYGYFGSESAYLKTQDIYLLYIPYIVLKVK